MQHRVPVTTGSADASSAFAGGFKATHARFPSLLRLRRHTHEGDCLSIVLDGGLEKDFGRTSLPSPPGTVQTIPADAAHEDMFQRAGARTLIVEPDGLAAAELKALGLRLDELRHGRDAYAAGIAAAIARELDAPDEASALVIEGLLLELAGQLLRKRAPDRSAPWLARVEDALRSRFRDRMSVSDLAAEASVHPTHLAREFRRHYGMTVGEYARRLRLDWAARRLTSSDEPIASIAVRAGFADQSHFTRHFGRYTGRTPGAYRAAAR